MAKAAAETMAMGGEAGCRILGWAGTDGDKDGVRGWTRIEDGMDEVRGGTGIDDGEITPAGVNLAGAVLTGRGTWFMGVGAGAVG